MRCTAMSRLGVAFTSTCQSPEIRLTLNVGSDRSPNVARPSNVDWLPDDRLNIGPPIEAPVGAASVAALSHPPETSARMSVAVVRGTDMWCLLALGFDSRGSRVAQASNRGHGAHLISG